uniref:Uncharacterized protein n=1 Tax=Manihot esculenta TaxID=3983 RepID=A0A2C9V885_MANES
MKYKRKQPIFIQAKHAFSNCSRTQVLRVRRDGRALAFTGSHENRSKSEEAVINVLKLTKTLPSLELHATANRGSRSLDLLRSIIKRSCKKTNVCKPRKQATRKRKNRNTRRFFTLLSLENKEALANLLKKNFHTPTPHICHSKRKSILFTLDLHSN